MQPHEEQVQDKHLIFQLGGELYGVTLMSVKEVIKLGEIKAVPYMKHYFKGVMNLRGQVIGIVDLREKFEFKSQKGSGLILVIEHDEGLLGAIVDELDSVYDFHPDDIVKNPSLETKIPLDFFIGVARKGERLVNLIDLIGALTRDEYKTLKTVPA